MIPESYWTPVLRGANTEGEILLSSFENLIQFRVHSVLHFLIYTIMCITVVLRAQ